VQLTESKAVVLIVDDEDDIRRNIVRTLGAQEYTFLEAQGDIELRHVLVQTAVDLIILDLNMPDFQDKFFSFSGLESLRFVQENYSHIPVIVFSAMSPHHRRDAYRLGAYGVVEKDGTLESIKELRQRVREALYEKKTMTLATPSPSSNKLWQLAQRIMEACFSIP
jgi:CheY-like chemotaxis protein